MIPPQRFTTPEEEAKWLLDRRLFGTAYSTTDGRRVDPMRVLLDESKDKVFVDEVHQRGDEDVVFVNTDADWAIRTQWLTREEARRIWPDPRDTDRNPQGEKPEALSAKHESRGRKASP